MPDQPARPLPVGARVLVRNHPCWNALDTRIEAKDLYGTVTDQDPRDARTWVRFDNGDLACVFDCQCSPVVAGEGERQPSADADVRPCSLGAGQPLGQLAFRNDAERDHWSRCYAAAIGRDENCDWAAIARDAVLDMRKHESSPRSRPFESVSIDDVDGSQVCVYVAGRTVTLGVDSEVDRIYRPAQARELAAAIIAAADHAAALADAIGRTRGRS